MQLWPANENAFAASRVGSVLEVGVGGDDHRRRVSELEVHPLARRALTERPADAGRPGERDECDARVLDEDVSDLARRPADDVEPARRKTGLHLELGEEQRGQRRLRGGLQDDGAAGSESGRDLVGDEVEREVEGRDRTDDTDRHAQRECELADSGRGCVHRHDVACELSRLDGRHRERRLRASSLDARRFHRLPGLVGDRPRDLFGALLDEVRDSVEDRRPLVRRDRRRHRPLRGLDRATSLGRAAFRDATDE